MRSDALDFPLPEELVARHPAQARGDSRLMVVRGGAASPGHHGFRELPQMLREGDLLVLNDTRVLPARLLLRKLTGGAVEGLFLRELGAGDARVMLSGGRLRPGVELSGLGDETPRMRLEERLGGGVWRIRSLGAAWPVLLDGLGSVPLPPYVRRLRSADGEDEEAAEDEVRYQTVWAEQQGSVAAPTASLHFDESLLADLAARGVERATLTLHVGRGTFLPVEAEQLEDHDMHSERFAVPTSTVEAIERTRAAGGRIIAAGTTVCRALEAHARGDVDETALMIAPGFDFQVVDALLTNFHTPRSTLLALVAGMAAAHGAADGLEAVKAIYAEAVRERYRFYSYGDASLWLPIG